MNNTYSAQIKVGSGLVKVTVQSDNTYHARIMLERQYGSGSVINLSQVSR